MISKYFFSFFNANVFLRRSNVLVDIFTFVDKQSIIEPNANVKRSRLFNCNVGCFSYVAKYSKLMNVSIGRYCSVASGFKVISGRHPTKKFVSTSPVFYSMNAPFNETFTPKQRFEEFKFVDPDRNYAIALGHDVWVGANVSVLEGVVINTGAIIASGAVVTKDIPPYEIWGGVPARKIGDRFTDVEKKQLMSSKWWENDIQWIRDNAVYFDDIKNFSKVM